jgi:regulation of enolase protein 1 (concanavalin A-like superfamily)
VQKLASANASGVNNLGFAVDNEGDQVAVGAPFDDFVIFENAGAAFIFERTNPLSWLTADIGNVALSGTANISGGSLQLTGSGADIWDRADEFFFTYQLVTGDFQMFARVMSLQNTDPWTKVGLMAREAFGPGERNAMVFVSPFNGTGFQWRSTIGGLTQFTPGNPTAYPVWLRLVRTGNTLSGYQSLNGSDWTFVGSTTLGLQATLAVGVALTSHRDGVAAQAVLEGVTLIRTGGVSVPAAPSGLTVTSVSSSGIQLSWTDNSTNENSFEIQRSTNGVDFVWVANGGLSTFGDSVGIISGTRYWYRVRAVNNAGTSEWSNIIDVTTPLAGGGLPVPWQTEDFATSGGAASFSNGVFTVSGDGADIWEIVDHFRFVYQERTGDLTITARIDSQSATHGWAKAGLMMREGFSALSRNALVFVTPDHGVGFQWRTASGGFTEYVPGPADVRAPLWLRLVRTGDIVAGYWSPDGNHWQLIGSVTLTFAHSYRVGMAVTSHEQGVLSMVKFSNVNVTGGAGPGGTLPAPWQNQDIGAVAVAGNASYSAGTFTISGDGRDIWETADAFHFAYQPWATGDATLMAEVISLQNTDPWAKVGIMFRQSLTADSPYAMMMLTAQHGSGFQTRTSPGASSSYTPGPAPTSGWLALTRSGNVFTGYISSHGTNWTPIASQTVAMSGTVYIGLAVTSHNNAVLNTATVRNVQVTLP